LDIAREGLELVNKEDSTTKHSLQVKLPKAKGLGSFVKALQDEVVKYHLDISAKDLELLWKKLLEGYNVYLSTGVDNTYDKVLQKYLPLLLGRAVQKDGIFNYICKKLASNMNETNLLIEIQAFLSDYSDSRHVKFLEGDIFRKLNSFSLKFPVSKKYRENMYIFYPFSTKIFAKVCAKNGFYNCLDKLYVNQTEAGYSYFKATLCEMYLLNNSDFEVVEKYRLFSEITKDAYYKKLYRDQMPKVIEGMIISLENYTGDNADRYKKEVKSLALEILGDSRVNNSSNKWRIVTEKAKELFIRWISEDDLDLFFKIIDKTLEGQAKYMWLYRSEFWKAYKSDIKAVWVAFGDIPSNYAKLEKLTYGAYSDKQISCLLMVIGDYMFVERSHSGALKIWPVAKAPCHIGDNSINAMAINNRVGTYIDGKDKVDHTGSNNYFWQKKVGRFIAEKCGISKPGQPWFV